MNADAVPTPSPHAGRRIGWGLAAFVVAGNMIGSGVYLLPVTLASTGSSSIIGWVICGAGALTLAMVFAGLGRFLPDADGLSDYTRRGLGRFVGYQTALFFWASCLIGNVAVAIAATGYLSVFFPALKEPVWGLASNLVLLWLMTGAYIVGARTAARIGAMTLVIGLIPIAMGVAAGVVAFSPETFVASWRPNGLPLAESVPASLVVIFWAFLGVESAAALSGSVRNPRRDVGRATVAGVSLALLVYITATVAVFAVIPAAELAESASPYADLTARVFGASVAGLVAACAVLKAMGTIAGFTLLGGETARSAAEKGFMPSWFGGDGTRPLSNPLLNGFVMSALTIATVQPSLGEQFGVLIGVVSALCLAIYAACAITLFRVSDGLGWKLVATAGAVFAVGAVTAAASGYLLPTLAIFAVATVGWLWVRRTEPGRVDPRPAPL